MATHFGDSSTETPNKRIKTENSTPENSSPTFPSSGKGKSKLESVNSCCGICLSEASQDGNNSVSRGWIDSCDHYFCFVCIMEWAKIESKCPLCKLRFSTIRRPAKPPVFPSDRLVHVPVRDQVYHYFGNATTGAFDPYSEAKCSICQSSIDENLLLLCDLCDSASHTYCVGLGATVPEGDWFCHDCTLLRDEHNKAEIDTDFEDQKNFCNLDESSSKREHASVFDIVRDPWITVVEGSSASQMLVNVAGNDEACLADDLTLSGSRRLERTMHDGTKLAARTLRQCRNVHDRIQALRDNWNSIRSGSLSFSPRRNDYGHNAGSKPDDCVNLGHSSSILFSSQKMKTVNDPHSEPENTGQSGVTSCSIQKVKTIVGHSGKPEICVNSGQSSCTSSSQKRKIVIGCPGTSSNRDSCEISKAWKMMDIAKSIEKRRGTLPSKISSKHLLPNSHLEGSGNLAGMIKGDTFDCHNDKKNQNMLKPQMLERWNLSNIECENDGTDSVISHSPINVISSHNVHRSVLHDFRNGSDQSSFDKISLESPQTHTASNYYESSTCMSSSVEPTKADSNLFRARHELHSQPSIGKGAKEKIHHPNAMRNCDAKGEIQSLVKLNLKLLTKDRKLGIDVFKQVARSATHSILVACGLEHPKPGIHQFSSSLCCHEESNLQFRRSTLMPNFCRECFYVFVKDVVNTILLEKIGNGD